MITCLRVFSAYEHIQMFFEGEKRGEMERREGEGWRERAREREREEEKDTGLVPLTSNEYNTSRKTPYLFVD